MLNQPAIELIDTHCHIYFDAFDQDRDEVIERARQQGITRILAPGVDLESSKSAIHYACVYPEVYAAVGIHPNDALSWEESTFSEIKLLANDKKVVAIGEIGLDYYREITPKDKQLSIFRQQLRLASELGLPVVIHNRNAAEDLLEVIIDWCNELAKNGLELANHPGVLHSFAGDSALAEQAVSMNFKIGIAGPITFKNAPMIKTVVDKLPETEFLLETDSPFLAPHPLRGKRNEPANVRIIADAVARIKNISIEKLSEKTTDEANKLFSWRHNH